ncbi:MAG: stage III sporulation protein AA, partial [Bacillota bacterium]
MSNTVLEYLPSNISRIIQKQKYWMRNEVIEIRMRVNQALQLLTIDREVFIKNQNDYYIISQEDVEKAFVILTQNSLYAVERQLSEGFITIEGGHRVGFTGQAVIKEGKIYTIKNINSLNYRITRQVSGIGRKVIKKIYNKYTDTIFNTLIIAPPLCGKTTLLRDLVYLISEGDRQSGINGKKIAVIDERSEIAGAYNGIAQNKIGSRTDLLDNCPKAEGIMILIRSMSPELIAFDEIGRDEDVQA